MSAPTFIRSFKRFSFRRGLPVLMLSDNGKAFEAAAKMIKKVVSSPEVQKYFDGLGIEWRFNVPKAPWWGGVFERLVRSTKRCLRKALGQAKLSHDELLTALVEIEMVLNSRPLTYILSDDLEEPLTPSHLLVGRRLMNLPDHLLTASYEVDSDEDQPRLTARLKYLNRSLNAFWKQWRREYLLELREAHQHHCSTGEPEVSKGDVVVVYSEDQPRSRWMLGRIERLIVGRDGQIRAASVHVSRNGRTILLDRPIQHLYPLEVSHRTDSEPGQGLDAVDITDHELSPGRQTVTSTVSSSRPTRSAAAQARDRFLAQAISEWDNEPY